MTDDNLPARILQYILIIVFFVDLDKRQRGTDAGLYLSKEPDENLLDSKKKVSVFESIKSICV